MRNRPIYRSVAEKIQQDHRCDCHCLLALARKHRVTRPQCSAHRSLGFVSM